MFQTSLQRKRRLNEACSESTGKPEGRIGALRFATTHLRVACAAAGRGVCQVARRERRGMAHQPPRRGTAWGGGVRRAREP